jgi:hypothetical protein
MTFLGLFQTFLSVVFVGFFSFAIVAFALSQQHHTQEFVARIRWISMQRCAQEIESLPASVMRVVV